MRNLRLTEFGVLSRSEISLRLKRRNLRLTEFSVLSSSEISLRLGEKPEINRVRCLEQI